MAYTGTPEQQIEVIRRASAQMKGLTLRDGRSIDHATVDDLPELEDHKKMRLKTNHDCFESVRDNQANLDAIRIISERITDLKRVQGQPPVHLANPGNK
jgi:hypothetical protein